MLEDYAKQTEELSKVISSFRDKTLQEEVFSHLNTYRKRIDITLRSDDYNLTVKDIEPDFLLFANILRVFPRKDLINITLEETLRGLKDMADKDFDVIEK